MRIVHISTSDIQGGAAKAAFRLHQALRNRSEDSVMYVAQKTSLDPSVRPYSPEARLPKRVNRVLRKEWVRRSIRRYPERPGGFEPFRDDRTEFGGEVLRQMPTADVVNLHWVAGFIDYRSFFPRATFRQPTIWTLHDMNPFTGGCHFDASCGRFVEKCGSCPQLGSNHPNDLSHQIWARKMQTFSQTPADRLFFVTPSHWLAAEARRSSMFRRFSVTVIPNGVDTEVFTPKSDIPRIRHGFDIPSDARVVLFLAEDVNNRRKGFALLNEALTEMAKREKVFLISLGKGSFQTTAGIPHLQLGTVHNDALLAAIYNVADLFVVPSLQDNLPNTILEAMSCGTPVIGFDTGGIREMIRDRETGFLVPVEDTRALAQTLIEALKEPEKLKAIGARCRQMVVDEFSLSLQAKRYSRLYRALIDEPLVTGLHPLH